MLYKLYSSILRLIEWLWYPISTFHRGLADHQAVLKFNIDFKLFTGLYSFLVLVLFIILKLNELCHSKRDIKAIVASLDLDQPAVAWKLFA